MKYEIIYVTFIAILTFLILFTLGILFGKTKVFHPTYIIVNNGNGDYSIPLEPGRTFRIYNPDTDTWIHIIVPSEDMTWYDEYKKSWLEPECQFGCEEKEEK